MTQFIETTNLPWTVERVYQTMTEQELAELEASGQAVDNVNFFWGRKTGELIAAGVPCMIAYAAIAKKVGRGKSTIAQCFYTWKTFRDVEHNELVPYSVYNHARQWSEPDEVLQYYMDHHCSVDEVETVFRVSEEPAERETFAQTELPRYFVGAWREMAGLPKERYELALKKLHEFMEIVNEHRG